MRLFASASLFRHYKDQQFHCIEVIGAKENKGLAEAEISRLFYYRQVFGAALGGSQCPDSGRYICLPLLFPASRFLYKKDTLLFAGLCGKFSVPKRREQQESAASGAMETVPQRAPGASTVDKGQGRQMQERCGFFQMPLHYPRYTRADYEAMPEWQLDRLLSQYGLPVTGDVAHKRRFAIGAFIWPSH